MKRRIITEELVFEAVLLAVFAFLLYTARGYPAAAKSFAVPTLALGIAWFGFQVIARIARLRRECLAGEAAGDSSTGCGRQEWVAAFWLALSVALGWAAGLLLGGGLFIAAYMRLYSRERWRTILATALLTPLATYLLFVKLLEIPLYSGPILKLLGF